MYTDTCYTCFDLVIVHIYTDTCYTCFDLAIVHMYTDTHQIKISELFFSKLSILFIEFADENIQTKEQ